MIRRSHRPQTTVALSAVLACCACDDPNETMSDSVSARPSPPAAMDATIASGALPEAGVDATRSNEGEAGAALRDAAPPRPQDAQPATAAFDRFGVRKLYPTLSGGREWTLPANAEIPSREWNVERNRVTRVGPDVFHTAGNDGETRLSVASPRGRAWWQNVEMTGYFRYTAPHDAHGQARHWELLARSEKHTSASRVPTEAVNDGVAAPAGTSVWRGFSYAAPTLNGRCLGSSYHGNLYVDGRALFEKEISHSSGYAGPRGQTKERVLVDPLGRWFGLKFVLRNADANRRVHMELWLDRDATQRWVRVAEADDTPGSWRASATDLDGCAAPPFSYAPDQLLTWAGPWITFRSDSIEMDFRHLSAREIAPL